jgi:ankyrin repeat protein
MLTAIINGKRSVCPLRSGSKETRLNLQARKLGQDYASRYRKNPNHHNGYAYYSKLDHATLHQLEHQYRESTQLDGHHFSNETLFGIALGLMKLSLPGYRTRAAHYILAAARLSSLPAQAIVRRILEAVPEVSPKPANDEMETWLCNAAKTGSLVGMQDLTIVNPSLAKSAGREFVANGGYNQLSWRSQYEGATLSVDEMDYLRHWKDPRGNSLLHYAAAFGNHTFLESLLQKGFDANTMNDRGETALYVACLAGNAACVTRLAAYNADAAICSAAHGVSCLHWLFNFEDSEHEVVAKLLCERGASPKECTLQLKDQKFVVPIRWEHFPFHWPAGTPLHWATFARSRSACNTLLRLGADVDGLDGIDESGGQTSLAMAAYRGDSGMVRYLLSQGADPNRLDGRGCSAAHMLAIDSYRMNRLFDMSLCLKWWVYHGSWDDHKSELGRCVSALSSAGGNIDARTRHVSSTNTQTPILDAAEDGNSGALLALLKAGSSSTSTRRYSGESLLHVWFDHDSRKLPYQEAFRAAVEALLVHQEIISARDSRARTLLHSCINARCEEDFQYLCTRITLLSSRLLEAVDEEGQTPLLSAVRSKSIDDYNALAVSRSEWLLDHGADINATDHDNCGFLYHVCANGQLTDEQCLRLIKRQLDPMDSSHRRHYVQTARSKAKLMTPLMRACDNSLAGVVNLLLGLMDNINELSASRLTAFDFALERAQANRQRHLPIWIIDGILRWDRRKQQFLAVGNRFRAQALQNRETFFMDLLAKEALFRRTFTESDICK